MKARSRLVAVGVAIGVGLIALPIGARSFIGAERCKSCHEFEFERWQKGPHARAHQVLSAEQLADPKCSTCHTMASDQLDEELLGVQCERCHGSGKYYTPDHVMKDQELARAVGLLDVDEVSCKQCHNSGTPSIEDFEFAPWWAAIDHGAEARKKWEAAQAGVEEP